jgi:hypothetical protein
VHSLTIWYLPWRWWGREIKVKWYWYRVVITCSYVVATWHVGGGGIGIPVNKFNYDMRPYNNHMLYQRGIENNFVASNVLLLYYYLIDFLFEGWVGNISRITVWFSSCGPLERGFALASAGSRYHYDDNDHIPISTRTSYANRYVCKGMGMCYRFTVIIKSTDFNIFRAIMIICRDQNIQRWYVDHACVCGYVGGV